MKLHHALPLALSALTALSFAMQEGTPRTRRTTRGVTPTQQEGGAAKDVEPGSDRTTLDLPGATRDDTLDVFGRRRDSEEVESPQQQLLGGWTLRSMKLRKAPSVGQGMTGLLVVSDNFLSLEIHGSGDPAARRGGQVFHMSMGGEYTLDPSGKLTLRSMVGSYQDENSDGLAWEGNGMQRDFKAVFTERQLMLTWAGNSNQLVFNRRLPSMSGRTDIFGRKIAPSADAPSLGTDIFGRNTPEADGGGGTDIFGRKLPGSGSGEGGAEARGGGIFGRKGGQRR